MKIDIRNIPVFYINMEKDVEKRIAMETMLEKHGFNNVIRIPGVSDPEKYYRGLAETECNIFSQVDSYPFLVLEDDCLINSLNFVFDLPDDADGAYLGVDKHPSIVYKDFPRYYHVKDDLYKVTNMVSSHAILYISKSMKEMFERICRYCAFTNPYHIDQYFASVQRFFNIYAFNDPQFYQGNVGAGGENTPLKTNIRLSDYVNLSSNKLW